MSEQPPATGQRSPDGRYFWDGQAWQPVSATPATAAKSGGGWGRTIVVGIVCLIVGTICGTAIGTSSQTSKLSPNASASPTPVSVQASPTVKAAPTPRQPVARMGQGSTVTPIHLDKGNYKVSWNAQGGQDNFIVHIHLGSQDQGLVNEIPPNPSSGETFFASPQADDYTLEVRASTLTWSITFTPA